LLRFPAIRGLPGLKPAERRHLLSLADAALRQAAPGATAVEELG